MSESGSQRQRVIAGAALVAAFIASRVLYDGAGIRLDAAAYPGYWQTIDTALLRTDLWRSIFYLHTQPPLMNTAYGMLEALPQSQRPVVMHGVYFFLGLALAISMFQVAMALRMAPWLAAAVAAWFSLSPGAILYEHVPAYAYPVMAALVVAAFCLYQFAVTGKPLWCTLFFVSVAGIALTWAFFHLVWVIAVSMLLLSNPHTRRTVVRTSVLPVLLVAGWYLKNLILFGAFSASSWMGMNLARITTFQLSESDRHRLVQAGTLSELAEYPPFRNADLYLRFFKDTRLTGIPVLDEPMRSNLTRNQHHLVYVRAGQAYLHDALTVIRLRPTRYAATVWRAALLYARPSSQSEGVGSNQEVVSTLDAAWNRLFYGQWGESPAMPLCQITAGVCVGYWIAGSLLLTGVGGPIYLWRNRRAFAEPQNLALAFMTLTILYTTAVGVTMEIGDNNRFRYTIEPFTALLSVFLLAKAVRRQAPPSSET